MNLFVVCRVTNVPRMEELIRATFPDDFYVLAPGQWIVAAPRTAQGLTQVLQVDAQNAAAIFSIGNYWGHAEPNLWEWLKLKLEQPNA